MRILLFWFCISAFAVSGQESTATWQEATIGSPALKLQLPGSPTSQDTKLPQTVRTHVKAYQSSYLKNAVEGLVVTLMYAEYAPDIVSDAKGAIDGTNSQWEKTGSKVAVIATQDIKVSGKSAMKQHGKLVMGSEEHNFTDIVVVQGNKLWQVIIMTKANLPSLQDMSQKIEGSLGF